MTQPMDYSFKAYHEAIPDNWYGDDALLDRILRRLAPDATDKHAEQLRHWGAVSAGSFRELADAVDRFDRLPEIVRKDAYNNHADHIRLPRETRDMLAAVHGARIAGGEIEPRVRYAIHYMLAQNGEAGVMCSVACTDGLIRALQALGDDARSKELLSRLLNNSPGNWLHGAQFVTEIQGGSDAATNTLRAIPDPDGTYRLQGEKWFCSNCTADYWLVTARPDGAPNGTKGVALFVVPRLLDDGSVNGHRLDRLKDKLGSRALPTAEITFDGATAWMLGAPDAGIRNMVSLVLVTSRIANVVGAAGMLRSAARTVSAYAGFRKAFGLTLESMPLVADSLQRIRETADLAAAGAFETIDLWLRRDPQGRTLEDIAMRVHVSIAKAISTRQAAQTLYEAMMLPAGNGIEERFSVLPRLVRDAAIYETWEGPYTLLMMQGLGDLKRFEVRGREAEFFKSLWPSEELPKALCAELSDVLNTSDEADAARAFRAFAHNYYEAYQRAALAHYA